MSYDYICDDCAGQGKTGPDHPPCERCDGSGFDITPGQIAEISRLARPTHRDEGFRQL